MKAKLGIATIILFIIGIGIVLVIGPKHHDDQLETILASSDVEEPEAEMEQTIDPDFYDKLKNGEELNVLIIGDGVALGKGASSENTKWYNLLLTSILEQYNAETHFEFLEATSDELFNSWMRFSSESKQFDLVFFMFGEGESKELSSVSEAFLIKLIAENPMSEIMVVAGNGLNHELSTSLNELANYYGIPFVNVTQFINDGEGNVESMTVDGILPNDEGNKLYSEKILNYIRTYAYSNKRIHYQVDEPLYKETATFANLSTIALDAFSDDVISMNFNGGVVGVSIETGENHGIFDVYIDGYYLESFDTYSEDKEIKYLMISDDLTSGEHAITIQPSLIVNEQANGDNLEILELITE